MKATDNLNRAFLLMGLCLYLPISFTGCQENLTGEESLQEENLPDIHGYPVVGTHQTTSFNNMTIINLPAPGDVFYGQNSNYQGNIPDYADNGDGTDDLIPFINTDFFEFAYGDTEAGERLIDMQCATSNEYVSREVERMVFGVNFADGRIKGYGTRLMGRNKAFNYLLVRGNLSYGINEFADNGDGTITDRATGLMWMQEDNAEAVLRLPMKPEKTIIPGTGAARHMEPGWMAMKVPGEPMCLSGAVWVI